MAYPAIVNITNVFGIAGLALLWYGIYSYSRISKEYQHILHKRTFWRFLDYSLPFLAAMPIIVFVSMYTAIDVSETSAVFAFSVCYFIGGLFAHIGSRDLEDALELKPPATLRTVFEAYFLVFIAFAIGLVVAAILNVGEIMAIGSIALLAIGEIDMAAAFFGMASLVKHESTYKHRNLFLLPILAGMILPIDALLGAFGHVFFVEGALAGSASAIAGITWLRFAGMLIYLVTGAALVYTTWKFYKVVK